jgi:hypothetical protein
LADRKFDDGKLSLAGDVHADITEHVGQSQRFFDKRPRSFQIPSIFAHLPNAQQGGGEPLRAATGAQY